MLQIENISKKWKTNERDILREITFGVKQTEIVAILGPNGSGKTTLLKIIAGLESPTNGRVLWKGDPLTKNQPSIGFLFQNCGQTLFPWQTVKKHLAFVAHSKNFNSKNLKKRIEIVLERLNLNKHESKYPYELSGGMNQLLAIARAFILQPEFFLLDEPFAALDYYTSIKIQEIFVQLWEEKPCPAIFVTHTLEEAIYMADRVIIFSSPPSSIIKEYTINLPHPRNFLHRTGPFFEKTRSELLHVMQGFL